MLARPGLAGPLFRLDNFCDPQVIQEKLYEKGRYADLIDFLHGKKLHRQALELLEKFGKDTDNESVTLVLRGPHRTVAYLQQLPPEQIDLILEYGEWPLREEAKLGMEVFLADTENAETLPRHRVLDFLHKINSLLAVTYLEHIIGELNDMTPDFHQRLIEMYLERIKTPEDTKAEDGSFEDAVTREEWKEKLQEFLKSSDQYNRARVFRQLPADGMLNFDFTLDGDANYGFRCRLLRVSRNRAQQNGPA
jgi:Vam6/Vps39-like protein vacuolar protein sorting-associated protein 39